MTLPYANSATIPSERDDIEVHCVFPPIPIRQFDYVAYRDPEGKYGYGQTAEQAIEDLLALENDEEFCVYCDETSDNIYKGERFNEPRCGSCHFEWNPKK